MVCGLALAVILTGMPHQACGQYRQAVQHFSPVRQATPSAMIDSGRPVTRQAPQATIDGSRHDADSLHTTTTGPVSPAGALYRSLAVPGWGQWKNGRTKKALFFFVAEAVCIGGYLYENARYTSGDYTGPEKDAVKTDRNSFLLYWLAAKVLDIMDAYVDAQFQTYDVSDITPPDLAH